MDGLSRDQLSPSETARPNEARKDAVPMGSEDGCRLHRRGDSLKIADRGSSSFEPVKGVDDSAPTVLDDQSTGARPVRCQES